jgi:hypothetical protein
MKLEAEFLEHSHDGAVARGLPVIDLERDLDDDFRPALGSVDKQAKVDVELV